MEQIKTSKLLELYKTPFAPTLAAGCYDVTMVKHAYIENKRQDGSNNDYIRLEFETIVNGDEKPRRIVENRFEKGFPIAVSHIRQQLKRENEEINPFEFFNELIEKKTPLKLYVNKVIVNGVTKTNIAFLEPLTKSETTETANAQETVVEDEKI